MRTQERRRAVSETTPRSRVPGTVTDAGGEALRRVGRLSRLGSPLGAGFRLLREVAITGVMIARGVTDALRQRGSGTDEDPLDEAPAEIDLETASAGEARENFDVERFDVTETEEGRLYRRKAQAAAPRKAAPKRGGGKRRTARSAGSRRR